MYLTREEKSLKQKKIEANPRLILLLQTVRNQFLMRIELR
jgi:hypothetical protein